MKTILFHGYLQKLYPNGIRVAASSAAEAITALQNFAGFRREDGVVHQITLPHFGSKDAFFDRTDREVIEVEPFFGGAGGKGGFMQILIGVALVVFATPLSGALLVAGTAAAGTLAGNLVMAGAMMVLGGVLQMLMPQPQNNSTSSSSERSNYLPANANTTKIGTPIPLLFGRRKVFGHILSFDVDATNLHQPDAPVVTPPSADAVIVVADLYTITYDRG